MSIKSALQISVELGASPGSLSQLSREINNTVSGSLEAASKRSAAKVSTSVKDALDQGLSTSELAGKTAWIRKLQGNLTGALLNSTDEFGRGLSRVQKAAAKEYAAHLKRAERGREMRERRAFERRKAAAEEIERIKERAIEDQVDTYSRGLTNAHQAIASMDFGAVGGAARGAGGSVTRIGRSLQHQGRQDDASALQKVAGKLGTGVASMGRMLTIVGAAVGGVALLVKSFLDLEAGIKDTNKGLVGMAGAANLALGQAGDQVYNLQSRLNLLHNTLNDVEFSKQWYTTPDMVREVMAGFSEGGITVGRLTKGIGDADAQMMKLQDSTALALTYSGLLGKSATEVAVDMSRLSFESGSTLEGIADGFSAITKLATEAGFDVKRFYAAVLESTTGLGMYNQRLDDAAGFLKTLSTVFGQTVGADFAKKFGTMFSTAGYDELIKEAALTGPALRKNLRQDAQHQIQGLVNSFTSDFATDQLQDLAAELFGKDGLMSSKAVMGSMSKMSQGQFEKAMSRLQLAGANPEVLTRYRNVFDVVSGSQGRRLGDAQAAQTPVSKMLQKMLQARNIFGGRSIGEVGGNEFQEELAAVQSALGLDAETVRQLRRLTQRSKQLLRLAATSEDSAELQALQEQFGVVVENGKVYRAQKDELGRVVGKGDRVRSSEDLLRASSEFAQIASLQGNQVSEDIRLGREISKSTNSMVNVLKTGVAEYLRRIYLQTVSIYDWISGSDEKRQNKVTARARLDSSLVTARKEISNAREQIKKIRADPSMTPQQREEAIAAQERVIERMEDVVNVSEAGLNTLNSATGREFGSVGQALSFATGTKVGDMLNSQDVAKEVQTSHAMLSAMTNPDRMNAADLAEAFRGTAAYRTLADSKGEAQADQLVAAAAMQAMKAASGEKDFAMRTKVFAESFGGNLEKRQGGSMFSKAGVQAEASAAMANKGGKFSSPANSGLTTLGSLGLLYDAYTSHAIDDSFAERPQETASRLLNDQEFQRATVDKMRGRRTVEANVTVNHYGSNLAEQLDTISRALDFSWGGG